MIVILIVWLASIVLGCAVGSGKGQLPAGLLFSLILGPLGVLLVLCTPNLVKDREHAERQKTEKAQLDLQSAQLEELRQIRAQPPVPPPPGSARTYRIAKDGNDLGDVSIPAIKQMLVTGGITMRDYYLDVSSNEWKPLDCLPDLAA